MKQYEQVIKVMEESGGIATLGQLYQNVDVSKWGTKTPFASIRRIVQNKRFFFKIKPGLWALNKYKDEILKKYPVSKKSPQNKVNEFNHTYYQGLLVEIGNIEGFQTFIPYQDKNKIYLTKPLNEYTKLKKIYNFTYDKVVKRTVMIDVSWFNKRNYPDSVFEVEYSTDINNSLLKFLELQDFYIKFNIVADKSRQREFENKVSSSAFDPIRKRVNFIDYEKLSRYHSKVFEYHSLKDQIGYKGF